MMTKLTKVTTTSYSTVARITLDLRIAMFTLLNPPGIKQSIRYGLLVLGATIALHVVLTFLNHGYSRFVSTPGVESHFIGDRKQNHHPQQMNPTLANATFVILARNSDVDGVVRSVRALEDRFNHRYRYPYVLLNEVPFTDDFKRRVSVLTQSTVQYGLIPKKFWFQPDWIDEEKAASARNRMAAANVKYGDSVSYRNMCRFNSGFFFKHELLQKYRWYWRVEPDVQFHCNIDHDPFLFMENNNKTYSFILTVYEITATIPSLWGHVQDFMKKYPEYIAQDNALGFLSHNGGEIYNMCHFWSNFEIADMDFWRSPAYTAFFEYLDSTGGFYYERWGDAPIHSIAAAILTHKDQIHFFEEIGYQHDDWGHCPMDDKLWTNGRCACSQRHSFDYDVSSCKRRWDNFIQG